MRIASVGTALPPHHYSQEELLAEMRRLWSGRVRNMGRLESFHRNVLVGGRSLALPLQEYRDLESFGQSNDAWNRVADEIGEAAVVSALERSGRSVEDIAALFFVSVTGISTPSPETRLINRLGFPASVRRTPLFGLGCAGGAAGIARVADYLRGHPDQTALLVSVELCSLTLQSQDISVGNLIASGLFGDGAAAVVMSGREVASGDQASQPSREWGPEIVATRSVFYPDTEDLMGWKISEQGFQIILSGEIPAMVRETLRRDVEAFLTEEGLALSDIDSWVVHPGGPRVLEAMAEVLELGPEALELTWRSLREAGNMSSASILFVLRDTMERRRPPAGSLGMMMALGPGFCSELLLVRW